MHDIIPSVPSFVLAGADPAACLFGWWLMFGAGLF
jgi:hypothetical protein